MKFAILINEIWNVSDSAPLNWAKLHEIIDFVVWIDNALISGWEVLIDKDLAVVVVLLEDRVERACVDKESALHVLK